MRETHYIQASPYTYSIRKHANAQKEANDILRSVVLQPCLNEIHPSESFLLLDWLTPWTSLATCLLLFWRDHWKYKHSHSFLQYTQSFRWGQMFYRCIHWFRDLQLFDLDCLWFSVMISICYKEKFHWWGVSTTFIY